MRDGFWRLVHPKACCNRLGWDDLELLGLFPGDLADEARLQARVPPECGEFWPLERLPELRRSLTELAMEKGCAEEEAELPLPPHPEAPLQGRGEERFECCGGSLLKCSGCGQHFKLWICLQTHKRESCPASAQPKVDCASCGAKAIQRHLSPSRVIAGARESKKSTLSATRRTLRTSQHVAMLTSARTLPRG